MSWLGVPRKDMAFVRRPRLWDSVRLWKTIHCSTSSNYRCCNTNQRCSVQITDAFCRRRRPSATSVICTASKLHPYLNIIILYWVHRHTVLDSNCASILATGSMAAPTYINSCDREMLIVLNRQPASWCAVRIICCSWMPPSGITSGSPSCNRGSGC
jgi:hypothetical protein